MLSFRTFKPPLNQFLGSWDFLPFFSLLNHISLKVLLGEIDDEKEANMNLKEVGLEEILEAQSRQLAEKEEQDSLSTCPSHILTNPEFSICNCFFGIFLSISICRKP